MTFHLEPDESGRFERFMEGKAWIGRICQHADGTWIGVAGKYIIVRGMHSKQSCFHELCARVLRYDQPMKKKKKQKKEKEKELTKAIIRAVFPDETFRATQAYMKPRQELPT